MNLPPQSSFLRLCPGPRLYRTFLAFLVFQLIVVAGASLSATESARRLSFDIPASAAAQALKRFSSQSGQQLLYSNTDLAGIRTNAVKGEFTAHAALSQLLADTPLVATHDVKSGAVAVGRETSDPKGPRAAHGNPGDRPDVPHSQASAVLASAPVAPSGDASTSGLAAQVQGRVFNTLSESYIANARVTIDGTAIEALTDESGSFLLLAAPLGEVRVRATYVGLQPQVQTVRLVAGPNTLDDFALSRGTFSLTRNEDAVLQLGKITVVADQEMSAQALAMNEQRNSPSLKSVIAMDEYPVDGNGNIGEFLKYIPGVAVSFSGSQPIDVSVRGLPGNATPIMIDGGILPSTASGDTRGGSLTGIPMTNVSRIEVTKVPTPANAASSLSGSVNMISKSAFERKSAQLRYNLSFAANSENFSFQKEPHTTEEKIFKILPGGNFDLTLPLGPRFGIVLTGSSSDRYAKLHYSYSTYNANAAGTGATFDRPYLQTYRLLDSPRVLTRRSAGIKADWKITQNSVLSLGAQVSHFESKRIATEFNLNAGTNAVPTPATGIPLTFGPDFVSGATGRGAVTTGGAASVHTVTDGTAWNLRYRYDNGTWRVQAGFDQSRAVGGYRDTAEGHFRQMAINLRVPVRVVFRDINEVRPGTIEIRDNSNAPVDFWDPSNYQLTTANSTPRRTDDRFESAFADVRRTLGFLSFPAAVQLGALERNHTRDIRRRNQNWTYNGINGDRSPVPYLSKVHTNEYHYYGFRGFPLISPKLAWEAFQANPALFTKTAAQQVTEETFRRVNSEFFDETVSAYYGQTEFSLFKYRLKVLGGVRYEKTATEGQGPLIDPAAVWQRNSDGTFVRNAAGQRIRRPEAGAANSMEQLNLTHTERGYRASRAYDGFYPSLHLNYDLTDKLVVRGAYARTYGKPNLNDVIPTATVDEADLDADEIGDPAIIQGNITVRNTGLKPWTADNYDLSLEYYTRNGGIFSAGVFVKNISKFFGNQVRIATLADTEELGLDPRYVGWRITSKFNSGDARVTGAEFNVRHSLREIGSWGRYFSVFVNGTKLDLDGDRDADFSAFTPESLNWGFSFSRKPVMFMAKWNYRGKRRLGALPNLGPDAYAYDDRRLTLDLNAEFQLHKSIFLYAAAQNVFNTPSLEMRYGSVTPDYAKDQRYGYNGVGITFGIKGTF